MMHWYNNFHGYNMVHPLGWIVMIIFWVFIILFIIILIKNSRHSAETKKETPLDIIKRRYAEGEISKEEFEQLKKDLAS
ncbi:MAG: SHOCT domain-containing protein [Desulfobulbaceae bacterium]|nr:SHOCT domain-containing protein [Desulfobulbaceae bacterium]